jgi:hypothetical protein
MATRYAIGHIDQPPEPGALDGELRAFVLMLQTTSLIERDEIGAPLPLLKEAVNTARQTSPEFAAQLLGQLATLEGERGAALAIQHYREALSIAAGPCRAELSLQLGMALQDNSNGNRPALLEAVKAYQDALLFGITAERNPESFALLQNNLALAYLAMPMTEAGDQLRMGIAVQSLRDRFRREV